MFIREVISKPIFAEGRKFIERTIYGKFDKGEISIKTTYMDDKPILKEYDYCDNHKIKNVWREPKLDIFG